MKKIIQAIIFLCIVTLSYSQDYGETALVDSTFVGKDIFSLLKINYQGGGRVVVKQPSSVAEAMRNQIINNASRKIQGYRIRIFFDNKQSARARSEQIVQEFNDAYPAVRAYREYENPYFKVTVGDFRNKIDALKFLQNIKSKYPSGFITKENINYPTL